MTAKEKARDLVDKYLLSPIDFPYKDTQDGQCIGIGYMLYNSAKQCALIAVDEIMFVISVMPYGITYLSLLEYWHDVKEEIEKI